MSHLLGRSRWLSPRVLLISLCTLPTWASGQQAAPKPAAPLARSVQPLRGTVYAADGSPAAGAIVWGASLSIKPLERYETLADDKGRYALELPAGQWYVWVRRGTQGGEHPGNRAAVRVVAGVVPQPVTIRIEERGTFRCRLLAAETGKPIVGGRLFLDTGVVLTADADGRAEIGGLARTDHEAFVVAPGRRRMRVLFDTTATAETQLDIPVARAGKLVGRVTDGDNKPIPARLSGATAPAPASRSALFEACDAEGRFEYDDAVEPGQPTRLMAVAPGYVREGHELLRLPPDGKPLEINFRLRRQPGRPGVKAAEKDRQRTVSGAVRSPDAKPVAGVVVRWGHPGASDAPETRTDAAGRFALVVPDTPSILAVLPRDFTPEFPRVEAGSDKTVEVSLRQGHRRGAWSWMI